MKSKSSREQYQMERREQLIEEFSSETKLARYEQILELIATPMRTDGTWNYDREACRILAEKELRRNK